jgi:uncharacterized membrane protein
MTRATMINEKGMVAGYFHDISGVMHSYLYDHGAYSIVDAPGLPAGQTYIQSINNKGQALIESTDFYNSNAGVHEFIFSDGVWTALEDPNADANRTYVSSINNNGQVVGSYIDKFGHDHAFLATPITSSVIVNSNNFVNTELSHEHTPMLGDHFIL